MVVLVLNADAGYPIGAAANLADRRQSSRIHSTAWQVRSTRCHGCRRRRWCRRECGQAAVTAFGRVAVHECAHDIGHTQHDGTKQQTRPDKGGHPSRARRRVIQPMTRQTSARFSATSMRVTPSHVMPADEGECPADCVSNCLRSVGRPRYELSKDNPKVPAGYACRSRATYQMTRQRRLMGLAARYRQHGRNDDGRHAAAMAMRRTAGIAAGRCLRPTPEVTECRY